MTPRVESEAELSPRMETVLHVVEVQALLGIRGERPMADIDLLVRAADERAMTDLLQRAGFKLQGSSWKHKEFARDSQPWPVKLDVHVRLAERLGHRVIELPNCGLDFRVGGVRGYGSRAALLRHLLLHTAGNMSSRWVRAIHLHDIARLWHDLGRSDRVRQVHGRGRCQNEGRHDRCRSGEEGLNMCRPQPL